MPIFVRSTILCLFLQVLVWMACMPQALAQVQAQLPPPSAASDQFITWESDHNPDRDYSSGRYFKDFMPIPNIEFQADHPALLSAASYMDWLYGAEAGPNRLVIDFADYLPEAIRASLRFTEEGREWVRWPLSPFDSQFHTILEQHLIDLGVPYRRGHYFTGRSTSSRSMLLLDPATGRQFSMKTSTNRTIHGDGEFQYRPYPARWGYLNRRLSDYYYQMRGRLKHLEIAWEAALLAIPPVKNSKGQLVDSAMTVRLMEDVGDGKFYHMSGFVFEDKNEVKRLAALAGVSPKEYVRHASIALGKGLIELGFVLGFHFTSAHLQNIRFELDQNYQLTGRIILLDLTDGRPVHAIFEANGQTQLLEEWKVLVGDTNPVHEKPIWFQDDVRWLRPFDRAAISKAMREHLKTVTQFSDRQIQNMVPGKQGKFFVTRGSNEEFVKQLRLDANYGEADDSNPCTSIFKWFSDKF